MNRRTYVALGGLGLLGALVAARLVKTTAPLVPDAIVNGGMADSHADARDGANIATDDVRTLRDESATTELRPAPEAQESVGIAAADVLAAPRAQVALALLVIVALIALILFLFLKEFLG